jgi:hypothetical protein
MADETIIGGYFIWGGGLGEKEFQQEVIDRLARIETKQDATMKTVEEHSKALADHSEPVIKYVAGAASGRRLTGYMPARISMAGRPEAMGRRT